LDMETLNPNDSKKAHPAFVVFTWLGSWCCWWSSQRECNPHHCVQQEKCQDVIGQNQWHAFVESDRLH
jgi:hypothetical protein